MGAVVFARLVHVIAVVLWIGGVAMVTTVLLPAVRDFADPSRQVEWFERLERRFAVQARYTTLLTGLSGLYLLYALDAWHWFTLPGYWWLYTMVLVWALFTLMLFVFEPLFLHRWFVRRAASAPQSTLRLVQGLHWFLLLLSLLTIAGAVAGAHGWIWVGGGG